MPWTCFLIEPTGTARRSLRRYSDERRCALAEGGTHDAQVELDEVAVTEKANGIWQAPKIEVPHDDPRWPSHCACGYQFQEDDAWQVASERLYVNRETGEFYHLNRFSQLPIGAMWYAPWYPTEWAGPDGQILCVVTPGGLWCIDQPAQGGGRWTRSGTPPNVTARPSIVATMGNRSYHGWLTDGVLTDDIEGRTYPNNEGWVR
jgi:hypothetical protein